MKRSYIPSGVPRASFYLLLAIHLTIPLSSRAEVKLPSIFGDNMVLQRESVVKFWGAAKAKSDLTLTVSWDAQPYQTKSKPDGNWFLEVTTPDAGGPYEIVISDGTELKLSNVLIGEVWVCSGQSNMVMPMAGRWNEPIKGSNRAVTMSANPSLRLFTVDKNTSLQPLDDFGGLWLETSPETVKTFSAAAYYFGKMLQEVMGVPVGLINASRGGSRIETWMTEESVRKFDWIKLTNEEGPTAYRRNPVQLYNAMIHPMIDFRIRGVIWYQGESNIDVANDYDKLMEAMVTAWRKGWGIGDFPFYYCQIAPYRYNRYHGESARLREAQLRAQEMIPNAGMAVLLDHGEEYNIHPPDKQVVGERLAYWALAKTYGLDGIAYSGPVLDGMSIEGNTVNLTFNHAEQGLTSFGKELRHFQLAGDNKRFYPAKAVITREGISVLSAKVPKPVAVRYAFDDWVLGDLFNTAGLPASSFRTDDWDF